MKKYARGEDKQNHFTSHSDPDLLKKCALVTRNGALGKGRREAQTSTHSARTARGSRANLLDRAIEMFKVQTLLMT